MGYKKLQFSPTVQDDTHLVTVRQYEMLCDLSTGRPIVADDLQRLKL